MWCLSQQEDVPTVNPAGDPSSFSPHVTAASGTIGGDQPQGDRAGVEPGKTPRPSVTSAQVSFLSSLHVSAGNQSPGPNKYGSSDCHLRKFSFLEKPQTKERTQDIYHFTLR